MYLGDDSFWRSWNNLWTAEEDRHGQVLHDYARDTQLCNSGSSKRCSSSISEPASIPQWDRDPYRVFAYTTVQERATQFSHGETGKIVAEYEPRLGVILSQVAKEEARHYTFYRTVFEEILKRDPDQALHSASFILPAIDMPGVTMPGFKELADVIRRAGIYGPRDYLRIVQEQIRYWKIESLDGLNELGRKAQEKILGIPARLQAASPITWRPGARARPSASRLCSTANSRWNDPPGFWLLTLCWLACAGLGMRPRSRHASLVSPTGVATFRPISGTPSRSAAKSSSWSTAPLTTGARTGDAPPPLSARWASKASPRPRSAGS